MAKKWWQVSAVLTHHTTDRDCCSCDVSYHPPVFAVYATTEEEAKEEALRVVCPVTDDLQYEAVSVTITGVRPVEGA